MNELWQKSASELAQGYRLGTWTPVDVLNSVMARLAAVNPTLNAVIALDESAYQAALASQARFASGTPLSLLDGIALTIKDNLLMAGVSTTWGCPALADNIALNDELPVARLRALGAVLLGKTNVPEFTLEGYTCNNLFGVTCNPWDTRLTPGGSSGGAVASVAAGITPLALCTDGGGSIRRPAGYTGLVGLKPSVGAIARADGLPSLLLDFEVVGPVGRSVADVRLMFEALAAPHLCDRNSRALPVDQRVMQRVLYVPTLGNAPVDPQISAATLQMVSLLSTLGCEVETADLPLDLTELNAAWSEISQIGLAHLFSTHSHWRAQAAPKYQEMASAGERLSADRLWAIMEQVATLRRAVDTLFSSYDVLIMPTSAAMPWPADEAFPVCIDGQTVGPRGHAVFTGWVNAAGVPAISLPALPSKEGLPVGVQFVGPWGSERALLALAEKIEIAQPWAASFTQLWAR